MGNLYKEQLELIINYRDQDNSTAELTESLSKQEWQNDPPNVQTEVNKEKRDGPIDSNPDARGSEYSSQKDNYQDPSNNQDTESPHRKKGKLSDQSRELSELK